MRTLQGIVTSLKQTQTATVTVTRQWQHPLYKKSVQRSKKYSCHLDGTITVAMGDAVLIRECRPVSKTKTFKVVGKVKE